MPIFQFICNDCGKIWRGFFGDPLTDDDPFPLVNSADEIQGYRPRNSDGKCYCIDCWIIQTKMDEA